MAPDGCLNRKYIKQSRDPARQWRRAMNKDWEEIDQLFHQALECPNEARAEFLASASQRDPALGARLQALLDAHENNHSFMESPVMRVSLSPEFGRWQTRIAESLVPSSGHQMIGRLLDGKYRL